MASNPYFRPPDKTAKPLPTTPKENMTGLRSKILWQIRWSTRSRAFLLRTGRDHPSVLWRYLNDNRRFSLVKLGLLPDAASHVAEIRAEYAANVARGQFKEKWFDVNIVPWCVTFSKIFDRADPVRILEIGAWEGRATVFLLTYFTHGHVTAVDTWAGMDEYPYTATPDLRDLEARFDGNVAPFSARVAKRKGSSLQVLPQLLDEEQKFDFIYVDGSHFVDDVLVDGITAWRLLKQGGVIIFDDFLSNHYPRWRANPAWAINLFLKYRAGEYDILRVYYQIILRKKVAYDDRPTRPPWGQTDPG